MMNNYHYLYIADNIRLARTTVVKFEDAAHAINQAIVNEYGSSYLDKENPASWKYFQNISGQPHPTDSPITIISLDHPDKTEIEFTKENLKLLPITKKLYMYGGRFYAELISKYPDQELLITGVLYAPDENDFIQKAINAKDGTLLYWDKSLVETNEYNLIEKMQYWSYQYTARWVNFSYTYVDALYPALYIGQYYLHFVQKLLATRLRACKTHEAHSYHVREYLRSHGMLDRYIQMLTLKQALFLYRNIRYIEANSGKRDTMSWLIENIMTERNLRVFEYTARHDVSTMLGPNTTEVEYDPTVVFKRKPLNFITSALEEQTRTFPQIVSSMSEHPVGNEQEHYYRGERIYQKLSTSKSNITQTKLLESIAEDVSDSSAYSLECVLLNHLFYYVSTGRYSAKIEYTFPGTKKSVFLSTKDATLYMLYCWMRSNNDDKSKLVLENGFKIPSLVINQVLDSSFTRKTALDNFYKKTTPGHFTAEDFTALLDIHQVCKPPNSIAGVEQFYKHCQAIHLFSTQCLNFMGVAANYLAMGEAELITQSFFVDKEIRLPNAPDDFDDWVNTLSFSNTEQTNEGYLEIAMGLFNALTGVLTYKSVSIKAVQKTMLDIMRSLSSYTVYFINDVNESELTKIPNCAPWAATQETKSAQQTYIEILDAYVLSQSVVSSDLMEINISDETPFCETHHRTQPCVVYDDELGPYSSPIVSIDPERTQTFIETSYLDVFKVSTTEL